MDKIQVKLLECTENPKQIMGFLARMTQRGHEIKDMSDLVNLYNKSCSDKLVKNLADLPHGTIKRFPTYTIAIVGASRRFLAQIRTHQMADFVSGSLQYSDWSNVKHPEEMFVTPYEMLDNPTLRSYYLDSCVRNFLQYRTIASTAGNDAAGFVLPNSTRNVLVIHAGVQEWQYIIGLRTCRRNSLETRYVCYRIWEELYKTEYGELLFNSRNTGAGCQTAMCHEGHMSCKDPLPKEATPTELIKMEFPLLCKEQS